MIQLLKQLFLFIAKWASGKPKQIAKVTSPEATMPGARFSVNKNGWLSGTRLITMPSPRFYNKVGAGFPLGVVWHYTATDPGTAHTLTHRISTYTKGKDRAASWHIIVGFDGAVYQSISCLKGAWHCSKGQIAGVDVNKAAIGIELEGHGRQFSTLQQLAVFDVIQALHAAYGIPRSRMAYAHSQFDPERRSDPGKHFLEDILPPLLNKVYGG